MFYRTLFFNVFFGKLYSAERVKQTNQKVIIILLNIQKNIVHDLVNCFCRV